MLLKHTRAIPRLSNINKTLNRLHIMSRDPSLAKLTSLEPLSGEHARWIKLEKINYTDPEGKAREWEMASRTTRPKNSTIDAVCILAIIEDKTSADGPRIVLQRQFRPPVEGVCIEMPAGLIDPNESAETCALRELKEETGYVADYAMETSPLMFNDPGFCNTNMKLITVKVDLNDERNANPQPELEEKEFIETFTVPLKDLHLELFKWEAEGLKIDARVQNIAAGIQLAKKFKF
ncbi:hypothetical protein BABINDRAFT_162364 [Babjeviella inositovora NRRL Y-12698]|uniref:Nudix hydrolase domain-containing protein n=1 Tax=Babjeviella inositovora NRRL Y-12698 TaxID=984486 RepID=A0A1E3QLS6_9ASCO|nr:uncharacterized protein BABINDRAFT_162364 [Babjeviella inositovora NRRL Y-12698]ODQ78659.1 hypothetical protein BABINDRAFT_162364 [Babjeviella inositovora NRRL Y-12698]